MKIFIFLLAILAANCEEMVATRDYTDYLKMHSSWEVADYEDNIFRGWTLEEAKRLLNTVVPEIQESLPVYKSSAVPSSSRIWNDSCTHEVKDQLVCGCSWAFGAIGMLSDRCCRQGKERGWLSVQELLSCDTRNEGCMGGWPAWGLMYTSKNGIVPDACYHYNASNNECPNKCENGNDWASSHVCKCQGLKQCLGVDNLKQCLDTGPVSVTFDTTKGFFSYKSGIFECKGPRIGVMSGTAIGYSDEPKCHLIVRNSWDKMWGSNGYFNVSCNSCGINGKYVNGNVMCTSVSE